MTEEKANTYYHKENFDRERSLFFSLNLLVNNTHNLDTKLEELSKKFKKCYLISKRPSFKNEEIEIGIPFENVNLNLLKQNNSTQNFNLTSKMHDENNHLNNISTSKTDVNLINKSSKYSNLIDIDNEKESKKQSYYENKNFLKISINQHFFNSNNTLNSQGKIIENDNLVLINI